MALKLSVGSRKQGITLAVLAAVLLLAVVKWRSGSGAAEPLAGATARPAGPGTPTPPAAEDESAPARPARRGSNPVKTVSADDVGILDPKDFEPPRAAGGSETGRDLFGIPEPTRPVVPTPTPRPPEPGEGAFVGPMPPPPPTPTPRPPEVTFKFVGTFGPKDHPIAVIQQGDETFNARAGDTLFGKFVLKKVGYESIDIGFVGFAPTETKRLGITP